MTPRENELLERLREATLALRKTRTERDTLALEKIEPIAIVGMGCRFPGGAAGPEAFWALLDAGGDAVQPLEERWALVGASPSDEVPRWAGLLTEAVEGFDAGFFGISPREAQALDPQHRLLLEVAWEGLEDAGIPARSLDGSRTGVFIGACSTDYLHTISRQPRAERDAYSTTGNMLSVAAGRLSHALGLGGPCLTVDTACSSSLVADASGLSELAGQGERSGAGGRGECDFVRGHHGRSGAHAGVVARWALPGVRRRGQRVCPGRGLRRGGTQATVATQSGPATGSGR